MNKENKNWKQNAYQEFLMITCNNIKGKYKKKQKQININIKNINMSMQRSIKIGHDSSCAIIIFIQ